MSMNTDTHQLSVNLSWLGQGSIWSMNNHSAIQDAERSLIEISSFEFELTGMVSNVNLGQPQPRMVHENRRNHPNSLESSGLHIIFAYSPVSKHGNGTCTI